MKTTLYTRTALRADFDSSSTLRTWCEDDLEQICFSCVDDLLETFGSSIDVVRRVNDTVETFEILDIEQFMANYEVIDILKCYDFIDDDVKEMFNITAYDAHNLVSRIRSEESRRECRKTVAAIAPSFYEVLISFVKYMQAKPYDTEAQFDYFVEGVNSGRFIHK